MKPWIERMLSMGLVIACAVGHITENLTINAKVQKLLASIPEPNYSHDLIARCRSMLQVEASRRPTATNLCHQLDSGISFLPVDIVAELLCPHLQREPVKTACDEITAGGVYHLLQHAKVREVDQRTRQMSIKVLTEAADEALVKIAAVTPSEVSKAAICFLEDLQAASASFAADAAPNLKQRALHERLEVVAKVLVHFVHTPLTFCTRPIVVADDTLSKISQMVLMPVFSCMRGVMDGMLADVRADSASYRTQMEQLNFRHKTIYDQVFSTLTAEPPLGEPQDVVDFNSMCSAIGMLKEHVLRRNPPPPPRVQPAKDILKLTVLCVDVMQHFKTVVKSMFGTVHRIELQFRLETKALYRMAEKVFLKGTRSIAMEDNRTLPAGAHFCSSICDVVGCLVVCNDFRSMREVVERLKAQAEPDVMVCEVKSRWVDSSEGGWRDLICIVSIGPQRIMCEIQVVHAKLLVARQGLDAHKAYAKYRSYSEMLNFAGLLSDSGCGGAGAGAGAGGVGGGSARANDDSNGNIGAVDDDGDASATTPRVAPFKTTDDAVNAAEVMGKTSLPESNESEDNALDERSAGAYSVSRWETE
eukprot:gene907-13521_t